MMIFVALLAFQQVDLVQDQEYEDAPTIEYRSAVAKGPITWTFSEPRPTGQFVTGDWWVLGPVEIIDIDPESVTDRGQTRNGSMVNPSPRDMRAQGYDSLMFEFGNLYGDGWNTYQDSLNLGKNLPATLEEASIVSTVTLVGGQPQQIQSAEILTVVPAIPKRNAFRPSYSGPDKKVRHYSGRINFDLLPVLGITPEIADEMPTPEEVADSVARPWLDHIPNFHGRFHHPLDNMENYGRDIATRVGDAAAMLLLDLSEEEKRPILVGLIQIGIDNFGVVLDGGKENWTANGGHGSGRKFPILFAGMMLSDPDMLQVGMRELAYFGEDDQTFFVAIDESNGLVNGGFGGYGLDDVGKPEWGYWHRIDPARDDVNWDVPYRMCCTANSWHGVELFLELTNHGYLWGNAAFSEYVQRYQSEVVTRPTEDWEKSWSRFQWEVVQAHR